MVHKLNTEEFYEKVYDFNSDNPLNFLGEKPAIIDFYADLCGPCKMVSPILEELSQEYEFVDFYKVDIDVEQEISSKLNIKSIPTLYFISKGKTPKVVIGALDKSNLIKIIDEL